MAEAPTAAGRNKGARRRRRLYLSFVCVFSVWACISLWDQTRTMLEQQSEMNELKMRLEEVQAAHETLRLEVTRLQDPEYIEQKVRKDFGYVRDGDILLEQP